MTTSRQKLLYSEAEAAQALGICTKTLVAEVREGKLPYVLVRGRRKYDPADLREYIEGQKQICRSESARGRRTGGTTFPIGVVDFAAAQGRRRGQKPGPKKPGSAPG